MTALRFRGADTSACLPALLPAVLDFCDRNQLTLVLGAAKPEWASDRTARNLADNTERLRRIRALQSQVGNWLAAAGIEFIFLKGTTQWPHFVADPQLRVQYDLDLFLPGEDARQAWDLLREKGYEPLEGAADLPTDHLPTLIRKTGWQWHGDYFDPEAPLSIDLHFQFWDERTERLRAPGVDEFWRRRKGHALDTPDASSPAHCARPALKSP